MRGHEQYIRVGTDRVIPIEPFEAGYRRPGNPMPADFHDLIRAMVDLQVSTTELDEVDPAAVEMLWQSMTRGFEVLREDGLVEGTWKRWTGHELCEGLIHLVANGMRYVWLPLTEAFNRELPSRSKPIRYRIKVFELLVASLMKARLDMGCPVSLASQPVENELTGLCRHYAGILRTLFWVAKRATGRFESWDLLSIGGKIDYSSIFGHQWNWLVDHRRGTIYAFDVTSADWQVDRHGEDSIFNEKLDAAEHPNRSVLMAELFWLDSWEFDGPFSDILRRVAPALIDPADHHDLWVLWALAQEDVLHDESIDPIYELLVDFMELGPRDEFAQQRKIRSYIADGERQRELVESMIYSLPHSTVPEPPPSAAPWE